MKKHLLIFFVFFSFLAYAHAETDAPDSNELFSTFFARITRGGKFPGIYLNPPASVQKNFLPLIKKSFWVAQSEKEKKYLLSKGIDIWSDWYKKQAPAALFLPSAALKDVGEKAYQQMVSKEPQLCAQSCPAFNELLTTSWDDMISWKRQLLTLTLTTQAPVFGNQTLLAHVTKMYELSESEVRNNVDIKILDHANFVNAAREMGWSGEIYFRGLTGQDPKNNSRHWIILDDEMLGKKSAFDYPLLRMAEISGILIHELSHVCQDLRAKALGYDVEVTSAEDALIIEGFAEHMAETAIEHASEAMTETNPWKLFAREQGLEIVYREGNESTGNLFPYTVGLPFVRSLFGGLDHQINPTAAVVRDELLRFLDSTELKKGKEKIPLGKFLEQLFGS